MSVSRVEVSDAAREDLALQSAWYVQKAGADIAERYLNAFDATLKKLQSLPEIGRLRMFRDPRLQGLRSFMTDGAFRLHLIFYRVEADTLVVFRVIHGMRDLPRRLMQEPGAET